MTTDTPAQRVQEYLRRCPLGRGQDPENISEIWFDPNAESIRLTASDLEEILQELDELRAAQEYARSYTEDAPQEQGLRFIDPADGSTLQGFRGGIELEIQTGSKNSEYMRIQVLDRTGGIEISSPRRLAINPVVENKIEVVTR